MNQVRMHGAHLLLAAVALGAAACSDSSTAPLSDTATLSRAATPAVASDEGAVYTMTNATAGNEIVAFHRASNGALSALGTFSTGGLGTGGTVDPLGSQYALILSADHRLLVAVNAGSNTVTAFRVADGGALTLADEAPSGGVLPVSLALSNGLLYVLNAGDNTVGALRLNPQGKLSVIPQGVRALAAGASGGAAVHFTADGSELIVSERTANRLETMSVGANGRLGAPVVTASNGAVPFGFDVTSAGIVVVSEAGGAAPNGAVSTYHAGPAGTLSIISASVDGGGRASCWVIVTADGRIAFVANSASQAIASAAIAPDGTIAILNPFAATPGAGTIPIDIDLSAGDSYLYTLEAGAGTIGGFAVGPNGTLTPAGTVTAGPASGGLQGVAAY